MNFSRSITSSFNPIKTFFIRNTGSSLTPVCKFVEKNKVTTLALLALVALGVIYRGCQNKTTTNFRDLGSRIWGSKGAEATAGKTAETASLVKPVRKIEESKGVEDVTVLLNLLSTDVDAFFIALNKIADSNNELNKDLYTLLEVLKQISYSELVEERALVVLEKLTVHCNEDFHLRIVEVLGLINSEGSFQILQKMLKGAEGKVQIAIIELNLFNEIDKNLGDEKVPFISHLSTLSPEKAFAKLNALKDDENSNVRVAVAETLGEISSERVLEVLETMKTDTDKKVRTAAWKAIDSRAGSQ
jgi:HEAT repeat protein